MGKYFKEGRREKGEGRKIFYFFLSSILYLLFFGFYGCAVKPYHSQTRLIMGTVMEIVAQDEKAIEAAFKEIEHIDDLMSNYKPESEISRLNKDGQVKASPETLAVVKASKKLFRFSEGAFDITVGPLIKLWNVKGNMQKDASLIRIPGEGKIKEALSCVGTNFIDIDEKNSIIRLKKKSVILDLGAIAAGYAVDRAIAVLKQNGVRNALVNAGGEIYCLGKKGFSYWKVGLQNPRKKDGVADIVKLRNRAVATSGDYEQFFVYENKRYAHIIDPRTGYPVDNGIISVSVFADDCTTADALGTAIFVLGKEKGEQLAKRFKNVEVKIITK
ncbi:MAG: FAD:protein FMN transferase [Candidatus Omnitrophota bacterium]|nr:FAD:protein FMN transferase [Candidatus Omnitrophota bacterium]